MKTINLTFVLILFCKISIGQCEIKTKRVTVFKDATVFIEREGNCDVNEKKLLLDVPYQDSNPNKPTSYNQRNTYVRNHIILGTLDIKSHDNKILSTRSVNINQNETLNSIQQVFSSNKGKKIKLTLKGKEEVIGYIYALENTGTSSLNYSSFADD